MKKSDNKQVLTYAYELLKGAPVDPQSIYGDASGSATLNSKQDEDEELMQKCKALALFRAQKKSQKVDPPFSIVQKEYEAVLREVFTSRAGDWGNESQTSSAVPHGPDETGTSTASKKPPTVGWTNQNQPTGSYRTTDPQILPQPVTSVPKGPGASRGPASRGSTQSGLYPESTHVTTSEIGRGQRPGATFDMPYGHKTPSGHSASGYDTALGETQPLKKEKSQLGGYI